MNPNQTSIPGVFSVLDAEDRDALLQAFVVAEQSNFAAILEAGVPKISWSQPAVAMHSELVLAVQTRMHELVALAIKLTGAVLTRPEEFYLKTDSGAKLNVAWNALLTADVNTLATFAGYGSNSLGANENRWVDGILSKLLRKAGVTMQITPGGGGGGPFRGTRKAYLTFRFGHRDLCVSCKHAYLFNPTDGEEKLDERTYGSAVVAGAVVGGPVDSMKLQLTAEPDGNPDVVQEVAQELAAKLLAHYGAKSEA